MSINPIATSIDMHSIVNVVVAPVLKAYKLLITMLYVVAYPLAVAPEAFKKIETTCPKEIRKIMLK